jgi:glycerophosphoryl diester phosphodiesterase
LKHKFKTKIPLTQLVADNSWGESSTDYDYMRTEKGISEVKTYANGMGVWIKHLKKEPHFIKNIKDAGLLLHVYTLRPERVNKETLNIFKKADGIFSDSPDFLHYH